MAVLRVLLTACAAFVLYAVLKRAARALFSPLSRLPGPWHTRFTSLVSMIHRVRGTRTLWIHDMLTLYGPLVRLEPNYIAVNDIEIWEEINRMGTPFRKTPMHELMKIGPDHMLFSMTDVKQHAARRRLFARALSMDTLRKNWEKEVRAKVELAVGLIKKQATNGTADVHKWWLLMASDIIARLSFGESFDMLRNWAEGKGNEYLEALENAGTSIMLRSGVPQFSLLAKILPWKKLKKIVGANDVVTGKGGIAVDNLRNADQERPNLFSNMLAEAETGEESVLTDDAVRSEAAGFLVAGSDTSAAALTYVVWDVLKRPQLQKRLEDEVEKLGPDFTDKDLERLPLMNNVIDEVLRLHSPTSGAITRRTPPEGVTWRGYYIPPDTIVATQHWTMIRNEELFPDPEEFDETRFDRATTTQRRVAQSFGLGTRSCIGIHLAKMEMRLATAVFFRECRGARIANNMTDDMMEQLTKFFTYPKGGRLHITLNQEFAK